MLPQARQEKLPQARQEKLLVQALDTEVTVYDLKRHRAHCLNPTAALVWRHCDGKTSVADLSSLVSRELNLPADEDLVWLALRQLAGAHLLCDPLPKREGTLTRREVIRRLGLAGGMSVLLPAVSSLAVRPASANQSSPHRPPPPPGSYTGTQGFWGNRNGLAVLQGNWDAWATDGGAIVIGATNTLTFTTPEAVNHFLPAGGAPEALTQNGQNPGPGEAGSVLAGQVLTLRLNLSAAGVVPGYASGLGSLYVQSGFLAGEKVSHVLTEANKVLGGGYTPPGSTVSQWNDAVTHINEAFSGSNATGYLGVTPP